MSNVLFGCLKNECITYIDIHISYMRCVFRVWPVSVHVFNCSVDSIRVVGIIVAMNIFTNFHVKECLSYLEVG